MQHGQSFAFLFAGFLSLRIFILLLPITSVAQQPKDHTKPIPNKTRSWTQALLSNTKETQNKQQPGKHQEAKHDKNHEAKPAVKMAQDSRSTDLDSHEKSRQSNKERKYHYLRILAEWNERGNHPKGHADSRDAVENFRRKTFNIEEPATWSTNLARLEVFLKSGHWT